jgi:hypothetical protein
MYETSPREFYRLLSTPETIARIKTHGKVQMSPDLASRIRPGNGLIVAGWNDVEQLGTIDVVCVVTSAVHRQQWNGGKRRLPCDRIHPDAAGGEPPFSGLPQRW